MSFLHSEVSDVNGLKVTHLFLGLMHTKCSRDKFAIWNSVDNKIDGG